MKFLAGIFCLFAIVSEINSQKTCAQKKYRGPDNPMNCVCNATYCDEFPPLGTLNSGQAAVFTSSQSGKRFERITHNFETSTTPNAINITLNETQKFQTIIGFGGAFTDAAGINLAKLSPGAQKNLIRSYYGPEGIGYTLGRTPMASCDFSAREYSYDDVDGDFNLTNFALTQEDYIYKIPFLKIAQQLLGDKLKLFASPWSAPGWMKETGLMKGGGPLKGSVDGPYFQTWANYFVRYFEEYAKNNITYWGVTMENEPENGKSLKWGWQALGFNASMERDFAKGFWGQALRSNPLTKNLKLMLLDQSRGYVTGYTQTVYSDPDAYKIVDGLAIHWYADQSTSDIVDPYHLTNAHNAYPDKFLLYTEASNTHGVKFGEWSQADLYVHDIIQILQHWVTGWTDWNICLDPQGGPNWVNNWCDSPIIVSNTTDEFEKQPMYYGLGHFAKFIVPDSVIIGLNFEGNTNQTNLEAIAALNPSGQKVVVLNNRDVASTYQISVINKQGSTLNLAIEPRSFTTIVWSE